MAKTMLTIVLVLMIHLLVGCYGVDSGESQKIPPKLKATPQEALIIDATEADLVEQMALTRQAYRNALESLIAHYKTSGNDMMFHWANRELKELNKLPQYNYIIEAGVAGPALKAVNSIPEADYMFADAYNLEKKAKALVVINDDNMLREAIARYNDLIRKHPSSDKIDDAAYRAAGIYEYFKDYTIALLYYQRTYQWNSDTENPARFKAARILDAYQGMREEALELYVESLQKERHNEKSMEYIERRIAVLSRKGTEKDVK
jgi:tetratricopeptide (TPR) repeat protein